MRIAMIGHKSVPACSGGIERHVEELGKRLVSREHIVTLYNRSSYSDKRLKQYNDMKLINIPAPKIKGLEAVIYSFIASLCAVFGKYDIVHYHAMGPGFMCIIPKLFRKKTIVTIHGLDWKREKWGKTGKLFLRISEYISAKVPDKTIVVSRNLKEYFENKYHKEFYYIPNGINRPSNTIDESFLKLHGIKKNKYILFLSRLVPEKGCHYLIEAFNRSDIDMQLVIAGGGSYTDKYIKELHSMAGEKVIFTGEVIGEKVSELYSNAVLYVLPSDVEGLPIGLLEAMSYGVCPIVSDIEENLEVVRENGFKFSHGNVNSLKKTLIEAVNEKHLNDIGIRCKKHVLEYYNWEKTADIINCLYENIK